MTGATTDEESRPTIQRSPLRQRMHDFHEGINALDWLMLTLALVSIGLLVYESWWPVTELEREQIFLFDRIICGIFFVEFCTRWYAADDRRSFPLRNWYEILGMIPVSEPGIRGFRLFRIIRIVILLSRFGIAADRAFGEEFTYRLVKRFKNLIADAISGAVTIRVLDEAGQVLQKGTYTRNLARALETHSAEIEEVVVDRVVEDPDLGRIRHIPFFREIATTASRVTQRIMIDMLNDPRMDKLVADILQENIQQLKEAIREKEATRDRNSGDRNPRETV